MVIFWEEVRLLVLTLEERRLDGWECGADFFDDNGFVVLLLLLPEGKDDEDDPVLLTPSFGVLFVGTVGKAGGTIGTSFFGGLAKIAANLVSNRSAVGDNGDIAEAIGEFTVFPSLLFWGVLILGKCKALATAWARGFADVGSQSEVDNLVLPCE